MGGGKWTMTARGGKLVVGDLVVFISGSSGGDDGGKGLLVVRVSHRQ